MYIHSSLVPQLYNIKEDDCFCESLGTRLRTFCIVFWELSSLIIYLIIFLGGASNSAKFLTTNTLPSLSISPTPGCMVVPCLPILTCNYMHVYMDVCVYMLACVCVYMLAIAY